MIAAPGFPVVLENLRRDLPRGGIPGCAIAARIADDQIGRGIEIRAAIDIRSRITAWIAIVIPRRAIR